MNHEVARSVQLPYFRQHKSLDPAPTQQTPRASPSSTPDEPRWCSILFAVGALVRRIEELDRSTAPADAAARDLLHRRGLTPEVLAEANALLDEVGVVEEPTYQPPVTPEEMQAREDALGAWYLEWSTIARTAIQGALGTRC